MYKSWVLYYKVFRYRTANVEMWKMNHFCPQISLCWGGKNLSKLKRNIKNVNGHFLACWNLTTFGSNHDSFNVRRSRTFCNFCFNAFVFLVVSTLLILIIQCNSFYFNFKMSFIWHNENVFYHMVLLMDWLKDYSKIHIKGLI